MGSSSEHAWTGASDRTLSWRLERVVYEITASGTVARIDSRGGRRILALRAVGDRSARVLLDDAIGPIPAAYSERLARALVADVLVRPLPGEPARIARRDLIAWLAERAHVLLGQRHRGTHQRVMGRLEAVAADDSAPLPGLAAVRQ